MTAKQILAMIDANVDAYYAGRIGYLTFTVEQRRLWTFAEDKGVAEDVSRMLRERDVEPYAASFDRSWSAA